MPKAIELCGDKNCECRRPIEKARDKVIRKAIAWSKSMYFRSAWADENELHDAVKSLNNIQNKARGKA